MATPQFKAVIPPLPAQADDAPILTVASIRALVAEVEADRRLLQELPGRLAAKEKRLEAAMMFVAPWQRDAIFAEPRPGKDAPAQLELNNSPEPRYKQSRNGEPTWTGLVMDALSKSNKGLTHAELMQSIARRGGKLGRTIVINTKPYYNAVSKLEVRKEIERVDGYFYLPSVLESLKSKGVSLPVVAQRSGPPEHSSAWFVLRALESADRPMTASEIRDSLRDEEGVSPGLLKSPNFIFNVLKNLMDENSIERDDMAKTYRLAQKARPRGNGASGANASGPAR